MEQLQSLLRWLSVTDLENLNHQEAKQMVAEALKSLGDVTQELPGNLEADLRTIHQDLVNGGMPCRAMDDFLANHSGLLNAANIPEAHRLEDELRDLAGSLTEEEWCTPTYLQFERAVQDFLNGESDPLERVTQEMEQLLETAWTPYAETSITEGEVTMESALGHQLLMEGVEEWMAALDKISAAFPEHEPDWQDVLDGAQRASRLLVAVDRFAQRLEKSA